MTDYNIKIKTIEKKGVLDDITDVTTNYGVNISYTHLYIENKGIPYYFRT